MSLWEDTPVTLTSFGPPSTEVQSSGNFLSRLFKRGRDDSDGSKPSSREVSADRVSSWDQSVERQDTVGEQSLERSTIPESSGRVLDSPSKPKSDESCEVEVGGTPGAEGKTYSTKRTLGSVLTRLSAILERRASTPQVYRDSDFKQYWMPDSSCRECYECSDKFTTFRRRHHCRICGQIFCNACCSQELPGKIIGYKGSVRVCTYCFKIAHRYAQKSDTSADPKVIKEVLHKYLQADVILSPEQKSTLDLQSTLRSPSDPDIGSDSIAPFDLTPQTEFLVTDNFSSERRLLIQDSSQLRNLWMLMNDAERGVEYQNYRIRLRTYQKCIAGNRIVDWLLKQDKVSNRVQAIAIGQALIDAAFLDPIHTITTPFRDDFTLYRPTEIPVPDALSPEFETLEDSLNEDNAPQWFQEIQSDTSENTSEGHQHTEGDFTISLCSKLSQDSRGDIKVDDNHFDEPLPRQNLLGTEDIVVESIFQSVNSDTEQSMGTEEVTGSWRTLIIASDDSVERETFEKLQQEHHEHLTLVTKQLLFEENIPSGWADIVISTVDRVSQFVRPDVRHSSDDMDIRKYIHIKKIPGGNREQTALLHGVIFTKNVAHKKMSNNISNPCVLLLHGSIEYQRVENKMSYLEPQILQEEEFLRKNIKKMASLKPKPDVLVVEKSVSRLAQDFLLKAGITLVYNVKQSVMERLSRFLITDIVASIDSLVRGGVKLGFCHTFSVRSFTMPSGESKTMLYFDGCATHLGCAIKLCGGSTAELKRVKKIMMFMIYASYHSRLEMAFCMDEFLKPPIKDDLDLEQKEPTRNSTQTKEPNETNVVGRTKKTLQNIKNDSKDGVNSKSVTAQLNSDDKEVPSAMNKKELSSAIDKNGADIDNATRDKVSNDVDIEHTNVCDNSKKSKVSDLLDDTKHSSRLGDSEPVLGYKTATQSEKDLKSERSSSFINFDVNCDKKPESDDNLGEDSNNAKVIFELGDQSAQSDDQAKTVPACDTVNQVLEL